MTEQKHMSKKYSKSWQVLIFKQTKNSAIQSSYANLRSFIAPEFPSWIVIFPKSVVQKRLSKSLEKDKKVTEDSACQAI